MSGKRYTEKSKPEAVKQVTERGHAAADVAARLGVSSYSLYQWLKRYSVPETERKTAQDQLLKRERIRRRIYRDREEARRDVFDYIEMFYNPKRRHGYSNRLSPVDCEKQYEARLTSV